GGTARRLVKIEMEFARARATAKTAAKRISLTKTAGTRIEPPRIAVGADRARVKLRALFLVAQNVIGAGNFLEALLRRRVARMLVGMMFLGQRAERFLDVGLVRRFGDAEDFIRVFHAVLSEAG